MRKFYFIFFIIFFATFSCKKNNTSKNTTVEYQMTIVERQDIAILMTYNDQNGSPITGTYLSGWKQKVTVSNKPYTAYLRANYPNVCSGCYLNATLKILVDGIVVKEQTGMIRRMNSTDDVAVTIQYVVN